MEKLKKVNPKLLVALVILIVVIIIAVVQIKNYKNDLQECYNAIKQDLDWNKFNEIIDKHLILKSTFEKHAYNKLYKAMDEEIETIKSGNSSSGDEEIFKWTGQISYYSSNEKYKIIREKTALAKSYIIINSINEYIQNNNYIKAYEELNNFIKIYEDEYLKQIQIAIDKKNEIQDKAIEQVIVNAQEGMKKQSYSYVKSLLSPYQNLENQTIIDMYQTSVKEEKAQQQAEEKARIEKERKDFEIYCYFNMIAWKEKETITDDIAYSKCAKKFGITKEQAKESYENVKNIGWEYQDKYPDIYEKYASQYYN